MRTSGKSRPKRPRKTFRRTGGCIRACRSRRGCAPVATYAVGDIHGCYDVFQRLLARVKFDGGCDRLWLVGDLVNRGPQSLATLRWAHRNRDIATVVLGNHDFHLLALAAGVARAKSSDTLGEILRADDGEELCEWLRARPLAHCEDGYLMVHAGVLPQWSADDVLQLAAEAGDVVAGEEWREFAKVLYGDEPAAWSPELRGVERWRVIINALTRMRVCSEAGVMDLRFQGKPEESPRGCRPWFDVAGRKTAAMPIICGHWAALGFLRRADLLALDSGCFWRGVLTAVRLEDGEVFQENAK